jgi:hypothetical protein
MRRGISVELEGWNNPFIVLTNGFCRGICSDAGSLSQNIEPHTFIDGAVKPIVLLLAYLTELIEPRKVL